MRVNPTPTCYRCKKTQPRTEYAPKEWNGRPNGLDLICRTCRAEMAQTPIDNGDGTFWIPFGRGKRARVDAADVALVSEFRWYSTNSGYAMATRANGHRVGMHRVVLRLRDDDKRVGDHINRDKLDNRRSNLRAVSFEENNRRIEHVRPEWTSQFRGVHWDKRKKKWRVMIRAEGGHKFIGNFRDEVEAARAYDAASHKYHGAFGVRNFPDESEVAA